MEPAPRASHSRAFSGASRGLSGGRRSSRSWSPRRPAALLLRLSVGFPGLELLEVPNFFSGRQSSGEQELLFCSACFFKVPFEHKRLVVKGKKIADLCRSRAKKGIHALNRGPLRRSNSFSEWVGPIKSGVFVLLARFEWCWPQQHAAHPGHFNICPI